MQKTEYIFQDKMVSCFFDAGFPVIENLIPMGVVIYLTDENIHKSHPGKFEDKKVIVIPAGEKNKQQSTVDNVISELIKLEADRETILIGVGGGVVTDLTGYIASIYMRGIKCCLVPTSILAMVDACIGGKNGVDVGVYKNMVGTVKQPEFLLYDYSFLETLPTEEWINGFAEIIKHACIKDAALFAELEKTSLEELRMSKLKIDELIQRNVHIKYQVVSADPLEQGERRLLNFGHTLGHSIENIYDLPHGHAVSIGMVAACKISIKLNYFNQDEMERVLGILNKYHLPCNLEIDIQKVWQIMLRDKKRSGKEMKFVILNKIGDGIVFQIPLLQLENILKELY